MSCRKAPAKVKSRRSYLKKARFSSWNTAFGLMSFCFDMPALKAIMSLGVFVSLFCLSCVYATAQTSSNVASPLGTNLTGVSYYSAEQPFLNIFKTGPGWSTLNNGTDTGEEVLLYTSFLDANGYPTTLTGGVAHQFNQVSALFFRNLNSSDVSSPTYQAGDYLLEWSGAGTFSYAYDPGNGTCSTSPCRITVSTPSNNGILITLTSTGSGSNYARNISLIYCGTWSGTACSNGYNTLLANGEMFNPEFINLIKPFKTLRFMDWMAILSNFQVNWTNRPLPGWVFWADSRTNAALNGADPRATNDGVPVEVMIALCNEVQADCWFNMPPLATDAYVTSFANCVHNGTGCSSSGLNSTSRVYVEYANELWNQVLCSPQGSMTLSCVQQVAELCASIYGSSCPYPAAFSAYQANTKYGALRAVQVGADWKTAWGADASRVIRVFGGWNGNPGYTSFWLGFSDPAHYTGTVASNVDAVAVAPYFGYAVPDNFTVDQLFTEMMVGGLVSGGYPSGMIAQAIAGATTNYAIASSFGLPMVAYEGGQTLVAGTDAALQTLYAAANRDPRMGTAYTTFLNGWKSLGATLFNNFTDIQAYSQWGYWGALENYQDTSSPKYNALISFISNNPCWWSGCATSGTSTTATPAVATTTPAVATTTPPSVPTGLAGAVASATQINLTWTASTGTVTGYNVFHNGTKVGTSTSTLYQDTGLSAGTTYTYTLSAYNAAGNTSAQSSGISIATPAPPSVVISSPQNGTLLKGNKNLNIATTVSDASGIASITITADSTTLQTCTSAKSCSASWNGKSIPSGTHIIRATASNLFGQSTTASVTILSLK